MGRRTSVLACVAVGMVLFGSLLDAESAPRKKIRNQVVSSPVTILPDHVVRVNLVNARAPAAVSYELKLIDFVTGDLVDEATVVLEATEES